MPPDGQRDIQDLQAELRYHIRAIEQIQEEIRQREEPPQPKPRLRVIQGGLAATMGAAAAIGNKAMQRPVALAGLLSVLGIIAATPFVMPDKDAPTALPPSSQRTTTQTVEPTPTVEPTSATSTTPPPAAPPPESVPEPDTAGVPVAFQPTPPGGPEQQPRQQTPEAPEPPPEPTTAKPPPETQPRQPPRDDEPSEPTSRPPPECSGIRVDLSPAADVCALELLR